MISLAHISNVRDRIATIESQFGISLQNPGNPFEKTLKKELERVQETAFPEALRAGKAGQKQEALPHEAAEAIEFAAKAGTGTPSLSEMVTEAAQKYRVDPGLVSAVAEAESGGDQSAVSSAGAIGVMQLMPQTAKALGVDPYDTKQNIEGGAKYLRQMLDRFDGDVTKAVAAYNAGPNAVKKYGGVPPYRETQSYVEHVLDLYR